MSVSIDAKYAAVIAEAEYMWFTTVRADGQPQPTPVWFVFEDGKFLIYSQPQAQKIRNIRANPKVALNIVLRDDAEEFLVIMGDAVLDPGALPATKQAAYMNKYAESIPAIDMTPESFDAMFSLAIRVTPTRVRGQLEEG
ncbi:MAG: TIGR03667 family PPOX class F420-dependent oxidoreductase [Anaerolineae bacterium]|nr:TIGR03667 family PPOX class F420-dependent oxidoreductase [Anaerolineae bacterium]